MNNLFTILCTIGILTGIMASGQDVQFTGSVKPVVSVGETFQLTYVLNAQGSNFRGPGISGIGLLSGPNVSTSSSIQSVNGRTTMAITQSFGYILQAIQPGTFEIPPATITVDGKTYRSNTLQVKIEQRSSAPGQPAPNASSPGTQPQSSQGTGQDDSRDVFLKAFVSDATPVQGEGIVITFKLFFRVSIQQMSISKVSSFQGFWSQNLLRENERAAQYTQTIDGQQYQVAEIRKIALYPLKSGRLTIDPMELECLVQVKRQQRRNTGDPFFDDFFNNSFLSSSFATVEKTVKSNPLTIDVKPLPETGKPADFNGAVGSFQFRSELDTQQVRTNEPITLKYIISGSGNIQLIEQLKATFPPDFEVYDPKVVSDYKTTASGVTGMQSFEYLIIPRKAGTFTIKPLTFSYYDLARKQYVSLSSDGYTLQVEKGSGEGSLMTYSGSGKEEIRYIGSDVRHIISRPFSLNTRGSLFYGSALYVSLLLIPLVLFAVLLLIFRRRAEQRRDVALMKNRRASRIARKRLKKADALLKAGEEGAFYEEISQALWGYLSDKFMIPRADLSIDTVRERLLAQQAGEEITDRFVSVLNDTEFARFAPGDKTMRMEEIYQKTMQAMTNS